MTAEIKASGWTQTDVTYGSAGQSITMRHWQCDGCGRTTRTSWLHAPAECRCDALVDMGTWESKPLDHATAAQVRDRLRREIEAS